MMAPEHLTQGRRPRRETPEQQEARRIHLTDPRWLETWRILDRAARAAGARPQTEAEGETKRGAE